MNHDCARRRLRRFATFLGLSLLIGTVIALAQVGNFKGQIGQLKSRATGTVEQTSFIVDINLQTFECLNADEDTPISNGDEPYLYVKAFWLDGTTINLESLGTATIRVTGRYPLQGNLGRKGIKGGDVIGIPRRLGNIAENVMRIAPTKDFPNGAPAQVALSVLACEQDMSSGVAAEESLDDEFRGVRDEMTGQIRTLSPVTAPDLKGWLGRFLGRRWLSLRLTNLLGVVDPDDVVGANFAVWSLSDLIQAGAVGVPFTMDFKKLGVHYRIKGVTRIRVPLGVHDLTLTIRQVRAIDQLEGLGRGDPDFQARVTIAGRVTMSPEKTGKTISPNWTFAAPVTTLEVPITIELFERDGAGSDEHCDINPRKGLRSLSFLYNIQTGQVTGDALGNANNGITSEGSGDDSKALVVFSIQSKRRP